MPDRTSYQGLNKTLLHALRHDPAYYGISLDERGWIDIQALASALKQSPKWHKISGEDIRAITMRSDKQRFDIKDNMIRAAYGHSIPVKPYDTVAVPPDMLFMAIDANEKEAAMRHGIRAAGRTYLHLSADRETARNIGRNKFESPLLLNIHAKNAAADGIPFYNAAGSIWLAEQIHPQYLSI
jgi:putative RNA 2'-phosphotransferase